MEVAWQPIANLSLHARARRIERERDASDAAILADIAALADADAASGQVAAGDGAWLGDPTDVTTNFMVSGVARCMNVRTFVEI
jgi:hypothetical protein